MWLLMVLLLVVYGALIWYVVLRPSAAQREAKRERIRNLQRGI